MCKLIPTQYYHHRLKPGTTIVWTCNGSCACIYDCCSLVAGCNHWPSYQSKSIWNECIALVDNQHTCMLPNGKTFWTNFATWMCFMFSAECRLVFRLHRPILL